MDHLALAAETLRRAEAELREILAKAAAAGDYAAVVQTASWAKIVHDLLERTSATRTSANDTSAVNSSSTPTAHAGRDPKPNQLNGDGYPRFFRKGDDLIRVAWSRRARTEYQHKTTEAVLKTMAETLGRLGKNGRVFSTDEILPLHDAQGAEIPAYQIYVCIGILKSTGLIVQHGRQGYSISSPDKFTDAVDALWRKLPSSK